MDQIRKLADNFRSRSIDVLIHNAGVGRSTGSVEEIMETNAKAPIKVATALLEAVARSTQKKIVLMTSQLGARRGSTAKLGSVAKANALEGDV